MKSLSLYAIDATTDGSWDEPDFVPDEPDTGVCSIFLNPGEGDLDLVATYPALTAVGNGKVVGIEVLATMTQGAPMTSIWQIGYGDSYLGGSKVVAGTIGVSVKLGSPTDTWGLSPSDLKNILVDAGAGLGGRGLGGGGSSTGFQVFCQPNNTGGVSGSIGIDAIKVTIYYTVGGYRTRSRGFGRAR